MPVGAKRVHIYFAITMAPWLSAAQHGAECVHVFIFTVLVAKPDLKRDLTLSSLGPQSNSLTGMRVFLDRV